MDVVCHHPGCTRSANGGDIKNGAILDRVDLRCKFVLVAILLEVAIKLDGLKELMSFRADLIDRNIFGPAKVRINALQILGCKCDFHGASTFPLTLMRRYGCC